MLEAKLWQNKTETKNVKVAKMVEFIKTCDQYCWGQNRSLENAVWDEWVISFCLGGGRGRGNDKNLIFAYGHE